MGKEVSRLKSTGIVRQVDNVGRLVLPVELRRTLELKEGDYLEVFVDGNQIVLKKYDPNDAACVFCGSTEGITSFKGQHVCTKCLRELPR